MRCVDFPGVIAFPLLSGSADKEIKGLEVLLRQGELGRGNI